MTAPAPTFQALLDRVNAARAACLPPREPVTLHQLGAVLVLKAQLVDLLEQTFGEDFRLSLEARRVPLEPWLAPPHPEAPWSQQAIEDAARAVCDWRKSNVDYEGVLPPHTTAARALLAKLDTAHDERDKWLPPTGVDLDTYLDAIKYELRGIK